MPERSLFSFCVAAALVLAPSIGNAQGLAPRERGSAVSPSYPQPGYGAAQPGMGAPYGMAPMAADPVAVAADPSRKLQQGDQLSLRIEEDRELPVPLVISPSGDVVVEPLPQAVRIASLTVAQAASEIKRQLDRDFYYNATVRLTLERASATASGTVTLSGYVQRVGAIPVFADRPMTVSQAILTAGGFQRFANDRKVQVTRVNKTTGGAESFVVDVKEVLNKGRVELDRQVVDGDRIYVPEVFLKR